MDLVRIGLVGAGGMGTFHAATLAEMPAVQITGVVDTHEPSATNTAARFGAEVFGSVGDLVSSGSVDAVVIASTDETHAEFAIDGISAGLPILCEKPLATTLSGAVAVADAEVAHGRRIVQLGFMREYDPAHVQLVEAMAPIGHIDAVRAVHRNANAERRPLEQIVGQSMVHDLHTVRFLTGAEVTSVNASGSGTTAGPYRHIVALCSLSNGGHAVVEFDDGGFAYDASIEVLGEHGDALTSPPMRAITRSDGRSSTDQGTDWFGWFADAYRIQDRTWIDSIRSGTAVGPSVWDGVVAQQIVEAILSSLQSRERVSLDQLPRPALYDRG